jgi:hypothetical protein
VGRPLATSVHTARSLSDARLARALGLAPELAAALVLPRHARRRKRPK